MLNTQYGGGGVPKLGVSIYIYIIVIIIIIRVLVVMCLHWAPPNHGNYRLQKQKSEHGYLNLRRDLPAGAEARSRLHGPWHVS